MPTSSITARKRMFARLLQRRGQAQHVVAGLLPIMWGGGTGSEVMSRIAAPMIGGMVTAPLLSLLVVPAAWLLIHRCRDGGRR